MKHRRNRPAKNPRPDRRLRIERLEDRIMLAGDGPDLVISALSIEPAMPVWSQNFTVRWTVRNAGNAAAATQPTGIYLSSDPVLDTNDAWYIYEATPPIAMLQPGETYDQIAAVNVGNGVEVGKPYYVHAATDVYDMLAEADETNNVGPAAPVTFALPDVDLSVSAASAPAAVEIGTPFDVDWTIHNDGTDDASGWDVDRIYLSDFPSLADGPADLLRTHNRDGESLPAGADEQHSRTLTLNAGIATGAKYLIFVTDDDHDQPETNEGNNELPLAITVTPPALDLALEATTSPPSVATGGTLDLSWTVRNRGTRDGTGSWTDMVWFSRDESIDPGQDFALVSRQGVQPLGPDATYVYNESFGLPQFAPGNYFLLFQVDAVNDQYESDETNNFAAVPLTIAPPDVDLAVTAATATVALASPGDSLKVSYTVTNNGTEPTTYTWNNDSIYLSADTTFDPNTDRSLAGPSLGNRLPLAGGASYTFTDVPVTLPTDVVGDRYILFITEPNRQQHETDEGNNIFAVPIRIALSDLVVTSVTAPATALVNQQITVSWTTRNAGEVPARFPSGWDDVVYFSYDPVLDINNDTWVDDFYWPNAPVLGAGGEYTHSLAVAVPQGYGGDVYLIVDADGYARQRESNDANNYRAIPIHIDGPNLAVTTITVAPTTGPAGQDVLVTWTVTNNGVADAVGRAGIGWFDAIYVSSDPVFNSGDDFIGNLQHPGETLAVGASYTAQRQVTLPSNAGGARYVLVVPDSNRHVREAIEGDSGSVQVNLAVPDVIVSAATAPAQAVVHALVPISITVTNVSPDVPALGRLTQHVYLSRDQVLDASDQAYGIGNVTTAPLAPGSSYTVTGDFPLPTNAGVGQWYFLIKVDPNNGQAESDETNNVFVVPVTFVAPDLTVTSVVVPTNAIANSEIDVTWTVRNIGAHEALGNWYDGIYISSQPNFGGGRTLLVTPDQFDRSPLAPGAEYTYTQRVTVPTGWNGARYILVQTDYPLFNVNRQIETNKANNFLAAPIEIVAPDLTVTAATAPAAAALGESVLVSWTVRNGGTTIAPGDWFDSIYVSTNQTHDASDTLVRNVTADHLTPLAAGASYDFTNFAITIPTTATGSRFLLFVADGGNRQGETNETNNVRAVAVTLSAPDLTVTDAGAGASPVVAPGGTLPVSWTVGNASTVVAGQDWQDAVFLSSDATLDAQDRLLLTEPITSETPLAGGGSYSLTRNVTIPTATGPGAYHLIFVTDRNNDQGESDENNNTRSITITVGQSDLVLTEATASPAAAVGGTAAVSWRVANRGSAAAPSNWNDRIYLSDDQLLDASDLELHSVAAGSAHAPLAIDGTYAYDRTFSIPSTPPGARYLLVVADRFNSEAELDETNNLRALPITISAPNLIVSAIAAPSEAVSGTNVQVAWTITNGGDAPASGTWSDALYLSADATAGNADDDHLNSFSFTGTLAPGESLTRAQTVELPPRVGGGRWIIVRTDSGNDVVEFPENDNALADDVPINVILSPIPNLQVSDVIAPATAFSSQQSRVEWTVTNTGTGATSAPSWYDSVYLSLDPAFDGGDVHLGNAANTSYLSPGDSYTSELTFTLPRGISGDYYFIVRADGGGKVQEYEGEADNAATGGPTDVELTPPPDLQAVIVSPARAFSGQTVDFAWTVTNAGAGRTPETSWYDSIYMSADAVVDPGDRLLAQVQHGGALSPGASYSASATGKLPVAVTGDFYFIVVTDSSNHVYEHALEVNNADDDGVTQILLTPPPDLEVTLVDAPLTGLASHAFDIAYTVTNAGATVTDVGAWQDRFYLSTDTTFDPAQDLFLGSHSHSGLLDAGQSYSRTHRITLPHALSGVFYAFVRTDHHESVFELDRSNNVGHDPVPATIESRPADLSITAQAPATAESGSSVRVTWTVRNDGQGDTATTSWTDRLFISGYPFILASFTHTGLLDVGQSYTRTELIPLPFEVSPGDQTLTVTTDYFNGVYELNVASNSADVPVKVSRQTPDLVVTGASGPAAADSGEMLEFTYTVRNVGSRVTNSYHWSDAVFLSADQTLDGNDLYLTSVYQGNPLDPAAEQVRTASARLPIDLNGTFYVIVRTDVYDQVLEELPGEANNATTSATPVVVRLSPRPDLVVGSIDAPDTGVSGQDLSVTYTVRNDGTAGTNQSWSDGFYLSRDRLFDRGTDLFLGYATRPQQLAPGASYTHTRSFKAPAGHTGFFYVLAVADAPDDLYERGAEHNNVTIETSLTRIDLAPPADLVLGSIIVPANGMPGRSATVGYTVNNTGTNPAVGSWFDTLYISADDEWDIGDAIFGRVEHRGDVPAAGSYSETLTAPLPGVLPGSYHVIVRSDIRNHIPEGSEANNIGGSLDHVATDAETLILGAAATSGSLATGQSAYYRIDVAEDETLLVLLDGADPAAASELYIRYASMPSRSNFDVAYSIPFASDQEVVVPTTRAGSYYVLVHGAGGASGASGYSISARTLPFEVRTAEPVATSGGEVTLKISGARFTRATSFELIDGLRVVTPSNVVVIDPSTAYATFAPGRGVTTTMGLRATDGASTAVLGDAVTVRPGSGALVDAAINGPSALRPGASYVMSLDYTNHGDADAPAPLLILRSPSGTAFGLSRDAVVHGRTLHVMGIGRALPGILRPGERASIPVFFDSPGGAGGSVSFELDTITADDARPMDWASVEHLARPDGVSDAWWGPVWERLVATVGNTWGQYVRMLARNATIVDTTRCDPGDPRWLLDLEVRKTVASLNPSISARAYAPDLAVDLSGRDVSARNVLTGETFVTYSQEDGSFIFESVPAGDYDLTFDGATVVAGGRVTVGSTPLANARLDLALGAYISGTVRSTDVGLLIRPPLIDASVIAVGQNGRTYATTTDALGNYRLSGLTPGVYTILTEAEGFARSSIAALDVTTQGASRDFDLARQATIGGRIAYQLGGPSSGQLRVLATPSGVASNDPAYTFGAQYEGDHFSLINLPAQSYDLVLSRQGYVAERRTVTVAAGQDLDLGMVTLQRSGTVFGTVTSTVPDSPAAFAVIVVFRNGVQVGGAQADAAGTYTITGLDPGDYTLRIVNTAGHAPPVPVTALAGTDVGAPALHVLPGGIIRGTVRDSTTGTALAGVPVTLAAPGAAPQVVLTDAAGAYRFSSLGAGNYSVSTGMGAAARDVTITALDGTVVAPADIDVAYSARIGGRLLDAGGAPMTGRVLLFRGGDLLGTADTNPDGRYSFILTGPGTVSLQATSPEGSFAGVAGIDVTAGATVARDFVAGDGSLRVRVHAPANELPSTDVEIFYVTPAGQRLSAGFGTPDASGYLTFDDLVPGTYEVSAVAPQDRGGSATTTILQGGAQANVDVTLVGRATLSGTVRDAAGQPIAAAALLLVSAADGARHFAMTADDGSYTFGQLTPGTHTLTILADEYAAVVQSGVSVSGTAVHNVTVNQPGSTLTGRVLDPSGRPIPGAIVQVTDGNGNIVGTGVVAPDGTFRVTTALGTGLTTTVTAPGFLPVARAGVDLASGQALSLGDVPLDVFASAGGPAAAAADVTARLHAALAGLVPPSDGGGVQQGWFNLLLPEYRMSDDMLRATEIVSVPPECLDDCGRAKDRTWAYYNRQRDLLDLVGMREDTLHEYTLQLPVLFVLEYLQALGAIAAAALTVVELASAGAVVGGWMFAYKALQVVVGIGEMLLAVKEVILAPDAETGLSILDKLQRGQVKVTDMLDNLSDSMEALNRHGFEMRDGFGRAWNVVNLLQQLKTLVRVVTFVEFRNAWDLYEQADRDYQSAIDRYELGIREAHAANRALAQCILTCDADHDPANNPPRGPGGPTGGGPSFPYNPPVVISSDPNDILGPAGFGDQRWVPASSPLPYTIRFENEPSATAPAQEVVITQTLDADLDWRTFRVDDVGWGDLRIEIEPTQGFYSRRHDLREQFGFFVDVTVSIDVTSGVATWILTTIDPATGEKPADPLVGFLPINDPASRVGEGFVSYQVRPKASAQTGAVVDAEARIVFDTNEPIDTPAIFNTLDAMAPASAVGALPATTGGRELLVTWGGGDAPGGSALADFTVYVSENGAPFVPWLRNTPLTEAAFVGTPGHTYAFYSAARDQAGNVESAPSASDARSTLIPGTITGTDGDDHVTVRLDASGSSLQFFMNSVVSATPTFTVPFAAVQSLAFDALDGDDTLTIDLANGNPVPAGGMSYDGGAGANVLRVEGSAGADVLSLSSNRAALGASIVALSNIATFDFAGNGGADSLSADGAALVNLRAAQTLASLAVRGSSRVNVAAGGANVLRTRALTIEGDGVLDLNDNDLIVDADATTREQVLQSIAALIARSRNATAGRWTGTGITSSAAAANSALTTLAAILNPGLATFGGEAVDENAILVKYTYGGDVNADGLINADDYFRIDQGFLAQRPAPVYRGGDFNYDGAVNADDYFLIDAAFLGQSGVMSSGTVSAAAAARPATPFSTNATIRTSEYTSVLVRRKPIRPIGSAVLGRAADDALASSRRAR